MKTFEFKHDAEKAAAAMGPAYKVRGIVNTVKTTSGHIVCQNILWTVARKPAPKITAAQLARELDELFGDYA